MSLELKSMRSVHFSSLLSLKIMSFVSWFMQRYACVHAFFFHVCVLYVTCHYLHTLFLISHFTRFLSSAGNRKMKKQAVEVDESEIEKWEEVTLRGRRERCRWDARWNPITVETAQISRPHRKPYKHTRVVDSHLWTYRNGISVLLLPEISTVTWTWWVSLVVQRFC